MKYIKHTSFLIILFVGFNGMAQNLVMAKAFFKKARTEFKNKDYAKALELIESAKEHLGQTNPDIMYLEAKIRYKHDINIKLTKNLINEFVRDADSQDNRIDDMTALLVDIESSDKYYKNGQLKKKIDYQGKKAIGEFNYKSCYEKCKSYSYTWYSNPSKVKTITHYFNDQKILKDQLKYDKVVAQTVYAPLLNDSKIIDSKPFCTVLGGENNEPQIVNFSPVSSSSNGEHSNFTLYTPKTSSQQLIFYNPKSEKKVQYYDEINKTLIVYDAKEEVEMKLENIEDITYYRISNNQFPFIEHISERMVKSIKISSESKGKDSYNVYRFDENGRPITLEFWKKSKIKDTITLKS